MMHRICRTAPMSKRFPKSNNSPINLCAVAYCCFEEINSKVSVPETFLINSGFVSVLTYNAVHQRKRNHMSQLNSIHCNASHYHK